MFSLVCLDKFGLKIWESFFLFFCNSCASRWSGEVPVECLLSFSFTLVSPGVPMASEGVSKLLLAFWWSFLCTLVLLVMSVSRDDLWKSWVSVLMSRPFITGRCEWLPNCWYLYSFLRRWRFRVEEASGVYFSVISVSGEGLGRVHGYDCVFGH